MRKLIRGKADEESDVAVKTVTNYGEAIKAFGDKEARICMTGEAYDVLMERLNSDEGLSRWLKALGKFYAGPDGLHMLFKTLLELCSADEGRVSTAGRDFYRFVREFAEKDWQNYKARNSKSKECFEFVRIR